MTVRELILAVRTDHRVAKSKAISQFIESFSRDMRILGHRLTVKPKGRAIHLSLYSAQSVDFADVHTRLHRRALWAERERIRRTERTFADKLTWGDPSRIQVRHIEPRLRFCESAEDFNLFDYLRQFQRVTSNPCVGAQIKAIVYDDGHRNGPAIMGILAVSSAMYFQGARDTYLGWAHPTSGSNARGIRERGLKRCLQLSVCMAVPPYDGLRCGRLVAMLAFSEPIQAMYTRRYGESLLGLTVTAGLRNYGVLYDRLHLPRIKAEADKAHLYVKLPQTTKERYFLAALSPETWILAERIANLKKARTTRHRSILKALRICGLPASLLRANETATYLGALSTRNIACLKSGVRPDAAESLSVEKILTYWRERFADGAEQRLAEGAVAIAAPLSSMLRRPRY